MRSSASWGPRCSYVAARAPSDPAGDLLLAHADALAGRLELADTQIDALVTRSVSP